MGSKSLGNLAEQIVPVFLAHQNKAAHTFAESIYTLVAPKGYGLRLFSFVVPKVPLGFVVCRRHPYIMKKAEMAVSVFLHSPVKVVAILEVFSVCSTKPLPKSRTTLDTRGERLRCFEFDEMDGI